MKFLINEQKDQLKLIMGNCLVIGCLPFGGLKVFLAKKFDMKFRNASNSYKTQNDQIGTMESIAFSGESDLKNKFV